MRLLSLAAIPKAWLTPGSDHTGLIMRPVFVPEGEAFEAAFRGALLLLADSANWEKHGALEPEYVAAVFWECFVLTEQNWGICS